MQRNSDHSKLGALEMFESDSMLFFVCVFSVLRLQLTQQRKRAPCLIPLRMLEQNRF